jgi:hypothetical protein
MTGISDALVERMVKLTRDMADWRTQRAGQTVAVPLDRIGHEALAIVAELPAPVDPEAERAAMMEIRQRYSAVRMTANPRDHDAMVAWFVLGELKRVRAEERK